MRCPDCDRSLGRRHVTGHLLMTCYSRSCVGRSPIPKLWIVSAHGLTRSRAHETILRDLDKRQQRIDQGQ